MDYTSVPRSIFYKEKTDLEIFTMDRSKNSLEYQFYLKLKQQLFIANSEEAHEYVLQILNNACYICSLIYLEFHPSLYFSKYMKIASLGYERGNIVFFSGIINNDIKAATMALVYNWLNTDWFEEEKDSLDGNVEEICEIKENIIKCFDEGDLFDINLYTRIIFRSLVMKKGLYSPNLLKPNYIFWRDIDEVIEDHNVPIEDIVKGIDYICSYFCNFDEDEGHDRNMLSKALNRIENEAVESENLSHFQKEHALETVKSKLQELGHLPEENSKDATTPIVDKSVHNYYISNNNDAELEQLRKERDEWKRKYEEAIEEGLNKEAEEAFNSRNGKPCFTSKQMGLLMYAVGCLTETPSPGKTTIGEVVERISGYSETTLNQNNRTFSQKDKEAVAAAIESKFPKLAAKVKTVC